MHRVQLYGVLLFNQLSINWHLFTILLTTYNFYIGKYL